MIILIFGSWLPIWLKCPNVIRFFVKEFIILIKLIFQKKCQITHSAVKQSGYTSWAHSVATAKCFQTTRSVLRCRGWCCARQLGQGRSPVYHCHTRAIAWILSRLQTFCSRRVRYWNSLLAVAGRSERIIRRADVDVPVCLTSLSGYQESQRQRGSWGDECVPNKPQLDAAPGRWLMVNQWHERWQSPLGS